MNALIVIAGLATSSAMLLRIVLILMGQLKGPVLAQFQRYGDLEGHFSPLTGFFFWLAWFVLFGGYGLDRFVEVVFPLEIAAILLLICSYYAREGSKWLQSRTNKLPTFPMWTRRLYEITTRHERRRLAYMWLRLPLRTRLLYNANTHAFEVWAEMVILATL